MTRKIWTTWLSGWVSRCRASPPNEKNPARRASRSGVPKDNSMEILSYHPNKSSTLPLSGVTEHLNSYTHQAPGVLSPMGLRTPSTWGSEPHPWGTKPQAPGVLSPTPGVLYPTKTDTCLNGWLPNDLTATDPCVSSRLLPPGGCESAGTSSASVPSAPHPDPENRNA